MAVISSAGKHLHYDRFGRGKRCVTAEESTNTVVDRASRGAQELDPRRRINQDQPAARRDFLNSARSPSQPDPSRASASGKSRGSSTSLRRARSTASRFVLRRYLRITSSTRRSSSSTLVRISTPSYTRVAGDFYEPAFERDSDLKSGLASVNGDTARCVTQMAVLAACRSYFSNLGCRRSGWTSRGGSVDQEPNPFRLMYFDVEARVES